MNPAIESCEFIALLERASAFHGHMCTGLYVGVRMALFASDLLDADWADESFVVEVETDRCPADGILIATGLSVGRKRYKILDYGKCSASFYNTRSGMGYRIRFRSEAFPFSRLDVVKKFSSVSDSDLFEIKKVAKRFSDFDLPGKITREVVCSRCGEMVQDGREVYFSGSAYCIPCGDYFLRGGIHDAAY
ncbi:FmdE family protein [Denitrobacterium detoxificans]|uniref:FmdE family protein n=1 Tax=Denitrobacterium detoxificans TaxID=79604 RepID=UPI0026E97A63|nr:FmdE family protein [Denitrobacterium detoxificans]MBE6465396.1 formylmethanofuran dehydrogenase [Denitrobacterium detoxificans]